MGTILNQELEITGSEALTYEQISEAMSAIFLKPKLLTVKPSLLKFRKVMIKRGMPKRVCECHGDAFILSLQLEMLKGDKYSRNCFTSSTDANHSKEYIHDYRNLFYFKA